MAQNRIQLLLDSLDEAYRGPAWHGPSLRAALRGISHREAALRPGRGRHNIWELAVHAAYWKYIVTRRLIGVRGSPFPHVGRNWFPRPTKSDGSTPAQLARAWRRDLELLAETHAELRAVVSRLTASALERPSRGHGQTPSFMIEGIAMHDVYHAGQIQLLRRLLSRS